jgi:alkylation response protein AidB-like acyl-CoA dehydrogenase
MDFSLTDEQRLLRDSTERMFADHYAFDARRCYGKEPDGWSRAMWKRYAELGLLGLPFDEQYGGSAGGPIETMIVMEAIGRALSLEPYFATVVLGGGLLRLGGSETMRADVLPKVTGGKLTLAFAHAERQSRYDLANVTTTARREGAGFVIDGGKSLVLHGDTADKFVVSARLAGGPSEPVGPPGAAFPLIEQVSSAAVAALCAEAVGAMTSMHELTVAYMKTRKQFGVAIGGFQVLQHRAADMLIALEQARSMAMLASMMAMESDITARRRTMSAAKVQIGRSGRFIGQQAIQIHGGIGMTMEASIGHYFKRVTVIDTLFGDADHHLGVLAETGGLIAA